MTKLSKVIMSCIDYKGGVQNVYALEYPMIKSDAGRSNSKRAKQSNDCTVRALALARNMAYDDVYDMLADLGRKCGKGWNIVEYLNQVPWAEKIAFPAVKGQPRMNPATFCKQYSTGTYICRVSKHVFTVMDGVVYDINENRPNRCIYTAWRIA